MRASLITLLSVVVGVCCQKAHYQSPQQAAILSDVRYLAGDGTFGAAYSQEDGVEFKEESDVNGDRRGSYSYIDPNGQKHTVSYTAGKNGFQVTAEQLPAASPQGASRVRPEYAPMPQYNPPDYQPPSGYAASPPQQYPRRYQPAYEPQPVVYQPQFRPQYQYQPQPQTGYHHHHSPELQAIPTLHADPRYQPQSRPAPQYNNAITTSAPRNFYPPGKLNFNRTPDGFSYIFNKS